MSFSGRIQLRHALSTGYSNVSLSHVLVHLKSSKNDSFAAGTTLHLVPQVSSYVLFPPCWVTWQSVLPRGDHSLFSVMVHC